MTTCLIPLQALGAGPGSWWQGVWGGLRANGLKGVLLPHSLPALPHLCPPVHGHPCAPVVLREWDKVG